VNIANLEQYVESRNAWAKIFGNKELSLLNKADRQKIADAIDADLSPENLTCDGEVRGAALQRKAAFLNRCAAELASIDPTVTFQEY
jgi:hypothetical protein